MHISIIWNKNKNDLDAILAGS